MPGSIQTLPSIPRCSLYNRLLLKSTNQISLNFNIRNQTFFAFIPISLSLAPKKLLIMDWSKFKLSENNKIHLHCPKQPDESKVTTGGPFSQLESGVKMNRQVSFRMQRKNILRKTFVTSDKWKGAARRVKIKTQVRTRLQVVKRNFIVWKKFLFE